jgi:hypothetical protein
VTGTVDEGVDVVARALAILDEESRPWLTRLGELAEQHEGGPDAG